MLTLLRQPTSWHSRFLCHVLRSGGLVVFLLHQPGHFFNVYLCAEEASEAHSYFGVTIRNSAIEDRFARSRNETEPVAKILLNSDIRGEQTTVTETRLRVLPSDEGIRFDVISVGKIVSQTTGISRQAMVESRGLQNFEAIKPFWFDGRKFLTKPAHGTIQALQAPKKVVSSVGTRMPLLRGMGDRIAWNEVVRRGPEINQAVAEDVSKDVFPKVDRIVNKEFAALGHEWSEVQRSISEVSGETQISWSARSNEALATVWAVPDNTVNTSALVPQSLRTLDAGEDIAFVVSEDAVSRVLSQYVQGGVTFTDSQLQQLQTAMQSQDTDTPATVIARLESTIRSMQTDSSEATLFTVELPKQEPLQIQFKEGDIRLLVRFQVHPKIGPPSGWMTTTLNFRGKRLSDREWTMAVRSVDVSGSESASDEHFVADQTKPDIRIPIQSENDSDKETTVQAGTAWNSLIQTAVEGLVKTLPQLPLPMELPIEKALPKAKQMRLVQIESANGILRCSFQFR